MYPIISRRHKTRFYCTIILWPLFFLTISVLMITRIISTKSDVPGVMFGCIMAGLSVYLVYKYFKNVPVIKIDGRQISFNRTVFLLVDIAEIQFTGKHNFPLLGAYLMEAAMIQFNNGQTRLIYGQMYENSWELKTYLKQVVIDKKEFKVQENYKIQQGELDSESYDTYKGNQFLTIKGIILWPVIAFLVLIAVKTGMLPVAIFMGLLASFLLYNLSWQMHYFKLSDSFLVVKNHNFFWKRDAYRLADIREVVFETRAKMPICLLVITNDFREKLYPADTLYTKTWLAFKAKLESKNIAVRNECL
jgi:hypothetical protein